MIKTCKFERLYGLERNKFFYNVPNFLFRTGGGVKSKLGPLCTPATNWPIIPAPGDCEDG
jgi:hypothetical protein